VELDTRWNWHDNYDAEASPDPKWVEVSDAGEAAFRKRDAEAKNELKKGDHFVAFEQAAHFTQELRECFRRVRGA